MDYKEKYNPIRLNNEINKYIFAYELTESDEGKSTLRFWRGNETTLWNCSVCLSYQEYIKGIDCIKISGWDDEAVLINTELSKTDSDRDGLSNLLEIQMGTNMYNPDTDGDGLDDAYEYYYLMTDPAKIDTDGNGISDFYEDFDEDNLINGLEYKNGTDPYKRDTDDDGLDDYNEIIIYGTDALKYDTDADGLSDMEDMGFGFDPLVSDTDNNGILDGDEKRYQIKTANVGSGDNNQVRKVAVQMNLGGNIEKSVEIHDVYGEDLLSSGVVGLIGVPVEIKSAIDFDEAIITFYYDKDKLGKTEESDLAILWYDEENDWYQILDQESNLIVEDSTISYKTTHFSTYMLVDKKIWYSAWKENLDYRNNNVSYDFTYVVDCSGSMRGNKMLRAASAMLGFVKTMSEHDEASIVTFNSSACLKQEFTDKQTILNKYSNLFGFPASGGTNVDNGLKLAISQYEQKQNDKIHVMILICDGDVNYNYSTIELAKKANIIIYTINLGYQSADTYLKKIASETGGEYYYCENSDDIETMIADVQSNTIYEVDTKDTDNDGLYDVYETVGFKLQNGTILKSDPTKIDTDGDGLSDYEETGILYNLKLYDGLNNTNVFNRKIVYIGNGEFTYVQYVKAKSNPSEYDTDNDGLNDYIDKTPWYAYCGGNNYSKVSSHKSLEYNEEKNAYICSFCGFEIVAPESEDREILSVADYRTMVALSNMLIHYTLERVAYYSVNSNLCVNEKLIINEMNAIRLKYNSQYAYSDEKGNCISLKCEIDNKNALIFIDDNKVTTLNSLFYNGTVINTLSLLFGFSGMGELSAIATLIGVGVDDRLSNEDMISIGNIMISAYGSIKDNRIASIASTGISVVLSAYDIATGDINKGDIEIRICLHRGGYGRSAAQSVGTFVMDNRNKLKFVEYAEYGYVDEVKPE